MAIWPASLPQKALQDGYEETFGDPTIRTSMDAGPEKVRRRYTASPDAFRVQIDLDETSLQLTELRRFFKTDTQGGALSFVFEHPTSGQRLNFRFTSGGIKITTLGGTMYRASFGLETVL